MRQPGQRQLPLGVKEVVTGGRSNASTLSVGISSPWPSEDSTRLLGVPLLGPCGEGKDR